MIVVPPPFCQPLSVTYTDRYLRSPLAVRVLFEVLRSLGDEHGLFTSETTLLVKLFGRQDDERDEFSDRAGQVRDIGVRSAMYGRTFFIALSLAALATWSLCSRSL